MISTAFTYAQKAYLEGLPGPRAADEGARAAHVLALALLVPGDDRLVVMRALHLCSSVEKLYGPPIWKKITTFHYETERWGDI